MAKTPVVDELRDRDEKLFHLARVALKGGDQDIALLVRKYARHYRSSDPSLAERLVRLLRQSPVRGSPLRGSEPAGLPVDGDSRLPLMRIIEAPVLEFEPVYDSSTSITLNQVLRERLAEDRLAGLGVSPTRSVLLTGPPGVGKTLSAKWIARELGQPLAILNLSAVMSSFLGRTGSNLRAVLDHARDNGCILLIDELDAIAKRRDDTSETGELKRLVAVLLQEVDEWLPSGLLLAATNHSQLLDPAVWRRFEVVVEFPLPDREGLESLVRQHLQLESQSPWPSVLGLAMAGSSHSDAVRTLTYARRVAAVEGCPVEESLGRVLCDTAKSLPRAQRRYLAVALVQGGITTQRLASQITGVARDTIRKGLGSAREGVE